MSESDQMRITASSLLISLEPPVVDRMRMRMSEDSSKLSTILHWISIVISPADTTSSFSLPWCIIWSTHVLPLFQFLPRCCHEQCCMLVEYQSDMEDEYMAFVTDLCWHRLQDKVNNKVPCFPVVPDPADVSTMSSVLKTVIRLLNAWKACTGLPDEDSPKITKMRQRFI